MRNRKSIRTKFMKENSFRKQRIKDFNLSKMKTKKVRDWYIIKKKSDMVFNRRTGSGSGSLVFYHDNKVYRYLPKSNYKNWKYLYKKGFPVESIIGKANVKESKEINKIINKVDLILYNYNGHRGPLRGKPPKIDVRKKDGFVLVKSKVEGLSFTLHKQHKDRPVVTINKLKDSRKNKLTKFQKKSIGRQILKTITSMWNQKIFHGHPHSGNWAINFEKGVPKVKLIDFSRTMNFKKIERKDFKGFNNFPPYYVVAADFACVLRTLKEIGFGGFGKKKVIKYLCKKLIKNFDKLKDVETSDFKIFWGSVNDYTYNFVKELGVKIDKNIIQNIVKKEYGIDKSVKLSYFD